MFFQFSLDFLFAGLFAFYDYNEEWTDSQKIFCDNILKYVIIKLRNYSQNL